MYFRIVAMPAAQAPKNLSRSSEGRLLFDVRRHSSTTDIFGNPQTRGYDLDAFLAKESRCVADDGLDPVVDTNAHHGMWPWASDVDRLPDAIKNERAPVSDTASPNLTGLTHLRIGAGGIKWSVRDLLVRHSTQNVRGSSDSPFGTGTE